MEFAPGQAEAQRASDAFTDDAEAARFWAEGADEVFAVEELSYPGGAGQAQRLRLYRCGAGSAPVLVYVHGGGWAGGSIELNDRAARRLAGARCHVVSLSYRLAPEHPFPAGLEDVAAAVGWLKGARVPGLEVDRMGIGGASAGANLALAAALCLPRETFRALVLFYGVYGADTGTESYLAHAGGPGLTRARMEEYLALYDPQGRHREDPRLAPLLGELAGLPPVLNVAAEFDVLRSESEALVNKLLTSGVQVEAWTEPGVTHGFINRGRLVPSSDRALSRSAEWLSRQI